MRLGAAGPSEYKTKAYMSFACFVCFFLPEMGDKSFPFLNPCWRAVLYYGSCGLLKLNVSQLWASDFELKSYWNISSTNICMSHRTSSGHELPEAPFHLGLGRAVAAFSVILRSRYRRASSSRTINIFTTKSEVIPDNNDSRMDRGVSSKSVGLI